MIKLTLICLLNLILFEYCGISQQMKIDFNFGKNGTLLFTNQNWVTEISPKVLNFQNELYLFHAIKKSFQDSRLVIAKMNNAGQLDKQYFDNGYKYTDINLTKGIDSFNFLKATIKFLPTIHDQILVFSSMIKKDSTSRRVSMCFKIDFNGDIDSSFGNKGLLWIDNEDLVLGSKCILDSTGNIYVSKLEQVKSNNAYFVKLEKYFASGTPDISYGTNGSIEIGVKSTSEPNLAIDNENNLYISYSEDSIINIKSFELNGQPNILFGTNGAIKFKYFINNRYEIVKDMISHDKHIYIAYLSQAVSSQDEWGIIKIDNHGSLVKDFGDNGFLKITNSIAPITNIYTSFIGDYILSAGSSNINRGQLLSTVYTKNGTFTSNLNEKWILNYDSLKFQPYSFSYTVLDDRLIVIGSYSDASVVPNNIVILNLYLDKTTSSENLSKNKNISIFPNPSGDILKITSKNSLDYHINLYNLNSQLLKQTDLFDSNEGYIDISDLGSGFYEIVFFNNKGKLEYLEKIIKE